ncbi:MAG: VOC family protein, partial [Candidatus Limnocylindrales bacterium]
MLLGIDHVVLAVQDVDAASAELAAALGLEEDGGGDHPDWGTRNRILWLGNTFLELLGIADPVAASTSWLGRPVVDALATGPGMVAWAIASDSLEEDAGRLRERGAQLGPAIPGRRRRADGRLVRWDLSLPTRVGLAAPFLIEHHQGSAEWTPSERAVREAMPARLT